MNSVKRIGVLVIQAFIVLGISSCSKKKLQEQPLPEIPTVDIEYFDLHNFAVRQNAQGFSIDVNHDGRKDIFFGTQLVGDPSHQVDKVQFLISTNVEVRLPVNLQEQVPVMNKGDKILTNDFDHYQWYEIASILLVQKIISFQNPPRWDGHWVSSTHKYLPYQVMDNGKRLNGWIELSVDTINEQVILHKAAYCKTATNYILAGY